LIEDPLSEQVLEGKWTSGSVINVELVDGKLEFQAGEGEIPAPRKREAMVEQEEAVRLPRVSKRNTGTISGSDGMDE
ncbi:MAG: hypothetical protein IJJ14_04620, partial [Coriobacteriales bacterium]|nr:hypothetical protein [Coriobacteriales bacterium]